jgi:hypothetical protein
MTNDVSDDLAEVKRRISEIKKRKRHQVRWTLSSHTAELAIGAIEGVEKPRPAPRKGKSRRRKRTKRLL